MPDVSPYESQLIQEGIAQAERYTQALDPSSVKLDDRKLEDLLMYVQEYSRGIRFFSTEKNPAESIANWEEFYRNQPVFTLARIAAKDPTEIKNSFDNLLAAFENARTVNALAKLADFIFSRFEKIDRWYAVLEDEDFHKELELYIRSYLASELQKLNAILKHIHQLQENQADFSKKYELKNKNNTWDTDSNNAPTPDNSFTGSTTEEKLMNASLVLSRVFESVFYTTRSIIDYCKGYFNAGIYQRQDHPPHVVLLVSFFNLFRYQQEQLNKLPARMLDHYYSDILKLKARRSVADSTFILLEPVKGFDNLKISKGTVLTAGKDKNNDPLLYQTSKETLVTQARVKDVRSVHTIIADNNIYNYYANNISLDGIASSKLFNGKQIAARTGFAIASTQFYLAKGERNVTLVFETQEPVRNAEFDTSLFTIRLTGEEGWIDSANPGDYISISHLRRTADKVLELHFNISIAQPFAVVAFNPAIHSGNFPTIYPVMELLLQFPAVQPGDGNLPLAILQLQELLELRLQGAAMKVAVGSTDDHPGFNGVTDLDIQNHESELDVKKPFYPFAAIPRVGSSFYIGCSDLYYKSVNKFSVNIEWLLPDNFRTYYEQYFPPYNTNKFRASLSILKEKEWLRIKDVSLIDTVRDNGRFIKLMVNNPGVKPDDQHDTAQVSRFDTGKQNGTLRLKLLYPDFGHEIYPQLITSAVLERSAKSGKVDFFSIIKSKLNDSAISIKLPEDAGDPQGYFRIDIYNILAQQWKDEDRGKDVLRQGIAKKLKEFNGTGYTEQNKAVVNDNHIFSRLLAFLRKVRVVGNDVYFDRDEQNVADVAGNIRDKINTKASRILPRQRELAMLISGEVDVVIDEISLAIATSLWEGRANDTALSGTTVKYVLEQHVNEANEVVNEMIARRIAAMLAADDIPPKPYTPLINTIAISYQSTKPFTQGDDQFFHIHPFGVAEVDLFAPPAPLPGEKLAAAAHLFPLLTGDKLHLDATETGQLLIGIENAVAGQNLTLFFQLAEGTRPNDKKPPVLHWWFLRYNQWHRLNDESLVADSTQGLQTTGIVEILVPESINNHNTVFPGHSFWFCVSVSNNPDAFPEVVAVKAQAVQADLLGPADGESNVAMPLPPHKINAFQDAVPGIKSIQQPVASRQHKMPEDKKHYHVRVSERLRHKQRAVTLWDYERLLLEEFPFIYKVNCINNYFKDRHMPGHVTVVPVANLKNRSADNVYPQPPHASYWELQQMEEFLRRKTSAWASVHAVNPRINYLRVHCRVKLRSGKDKGFYLQQLNNELVRFLTPWAASEGKAMQFSAKVYLSSVMGFINTLDYVDYVTGMEIYQYREQENGDKRYSRAPNGMVALFETVNMAPHEILASAPVHKIELI